MHAFWIVVGLVVLAGVVIRLVLTRQRQVQALREIAKRHRFNYSSEDLIGLHERYQNLDLIRQGHNRHAWNVVYGAVETGLIALFRYRYDVGFGANRSSRQWWVAVVETSRAYRHWHAFPKGGHQAMSDGRKWGRFRIHTYHESTVPELIDAGVDTTLANAPPDYQWEVRGPLIAVAAPMRPDPQVPEQLITVACELAQRLADHSRETERDE